MQSSYSYTAKHHVQITTVFGLPKIIPVEARHIYIYILHILFGTMLASFGELYQRSVKFVQGDRGAKGRISLPSTKG
jgi:hypothetical protein